MDTVCIIGFGRFGKILAKIISPYYKIVIHDLKYKGNEYRNVSLEQICEASIIFIAVPISEFKNLLKKMSTIDLYNTTVVDVCSVKVYPVKLMKKYLKNDVGLLATHPMFGPDSYTPFRELKIVISSVRDIYNKYDEICNIFSNQSISIIDMSPEEHDKYAAMSQGVTHFIGRVLNDAGITSTNINTVGFNDLLGVIEQTCNDSWDLFRDLQNYNPYTFEMVKKLECSIESIRKKIIQEQ